MLLRFTSSLAAEIKKELDKFSWQSTQVKDTTRAAVACTLALFLALFLQVPDPFWAPVTALVVSAGGGFSSTLAKSLLRFCGTILGAALALLLIHFFNGYRWLLFALSFFVVAVGIYFFSVDRQRSYAWILGYITFVMIVIPAIAGVSPESSISVAFYRSFEVTIGIFSGLLVSHIVYPQTAGLVIKTVTSVTSADLKQLLECYVKAISSKNLNTNPKQEFQVWVAKVSKQLTKQEQLLHHIHHNKCITVERYNYLADLTMMMRQAFCLLVSDLNRLVTLTNKDDINLLAKAEPYLLTVIEQIFKIIDFSVKQAAFKNKLPASNLGKQLDETWQLVESLLKRELRKTQNITFALKYLFSLKIISNGFLGLKLKHEKTAGIDPFIRVKKRKSSVTHDHFYIRHAILGAIGVLLIPFIWMVLSLPGISDIAVSIGAVVGMHPGAVKYKGFLRFSGCVFGTVVALLVLGLGLTNIIDMLAIFFVVSLVMLYFHFGSSKVSYFGTQAAVVFFIGAITSLHPDLNLEKPLLRLTGIILGVSGIILLQALLWEFSPLEKFRHNIRQVKTKLYDIFNLLRLQWDNPATRNSRDALQYTEELRLHVLALNSTDNIGVDEKNCAIKKKLYESYRCSYHHLSCIHWIFKVKGFAGLSSYFKTMQQDLVLMADSFTHIVKSKSEYQTAQAQLIKLEKHFALQLTAVLSVKVEIDLYCCLVFVASSLHELAQDGLEILEQTQKLGLYDRLK